MDQGLDSNGKRQTARLPFASGDSLSGGQSLGGQRYNQSDVYATRIGDDFDDVLDVPIQPQSGYQMADETQAAPVFEDVYTSAQSPDQASPYDFPAYDKPPATPIDTYRPTASRQRETDGYVEPAEQDFVGWPVLPEGAEEEEEASGNGRGGLFLRIGLVVGLVGVVCFWAYYFLGDYIAKRIGGRQDQAATQTADPSANTDASDQQPVSQTPDPQVATDNQTPPAGDPGASGPASARNAGSKDARADVEKLFNPPPKPPQNTRPKNIPPVDVTTVQRPERPEGPVRSTEPPDSEKAPPPTVGPPNKGRLTIQVGSFKDQGEADVKASGLNAATGGAFHVVRADIPGRGIWYRVQQVNGFASREAAFSYGNQLRARNLISDFIVTMR